MTRTTRIELAKENFKFSAGHFTIFSATKRENLHGHNFTLSVAFDAAIEEDGITFDYFLAKNHIEAMCAELDEFFLLPGRSRHLKIKEDKEYIFAHFGKEKIPFLKRDIKILPVENISVEELSHYFLNEFLRTFVKKGGYPISAVEVKVFSGPGQSAAAHWSKA